jgi:ABC-type antimicrobial peptide transport system permease subunit
LERQVRPLEIVGVVADAKYLDLHETPPRTVYTNALQGLANTVPKVLLRTDVPPLSTVPEVRRAVEAVVPHASVSVQTLREQLDASILPERLVAMLSAFVGALAAILVAIGLYGVLSYAVERRTGEIGIRIALGAASRDIVLMVGAGASALVVAGFAAGVPIALLAKGYAARVLTLVAATEAQAPMTLPESGVWPIAGAAGAMIVIALLASCLPARRATRVDPITALRAD